MDYGMLKTTAIEITRKRWLICFCFLIIVGIFNFLTQQYYITVIIMGAILLSEAIFSLNIVRDKDPKISNFFEGFHNFLTATCLYFLQIIKLVLWSLLFIIPGLIKAYAYSMSFFILADNKEISASEAIRRRNEMMQGHKMELFILHLSFIGWFLVGIITLGIGFIFILPYFNITCTLFYEKIKENKPQEKTEYQAEIGNNKIDFSI